MENKTKLNNKGYSLVEFIIVLAIIAVLSGMAAVTITMIHSAKAKEAATTFDSEVAELITKSKNMSCTYNGAIEKNYRYALKIYKDSDKKYYIKQCYYDTVNKTYIEADTDNRNSGKGICLSAYVKVTYNPSYGSNAGTEADIDGTPVYIRYNKDGTLTAGTDNQSLTGSGSILYVGDGTYGFYKRNGNLVSKEILRVNGSHQLK